MPTRRFKTAEEFGQAVDDYLTKCLAEGDAPRRSGFCLLHGCDYDVLEESYRKGEEWKHHYRRFEMACEDAWVKMLFSGKPVGAIFALKSRHGWQDTVKVDMTSRDAKMAVELADQLFGGKDNPMETPDDDLPVQ